MCCCYSLPFSYIFRAPPRDGVGVNTVVRGVAYAPYLLHAIRFRHVQTQTGTGLWTGRYVRRKGGSYADGRCRSFQARMVAWPFERFTWWPFPTLNLPGAVYVMPYLQRLNHRAELAGVNINNAGLVYCSGLSLLRGG